MVAKIAMKTLGPAIQYASMKARTLAPIWLMLLKLIDMVKQLTTLI